jgi:hypothetical protein
MLLQGGPLKLCQLESVLGAAVSGDDDSRAVEYLVPQAGMSAAADLSAIDPALGAQFVADGDSRSDCVPCSCECRKGLVQPGRSTAAAAAAHDLAAFVFASDWQPVRLTPTQAARCGVGPDASAAAPDTRRSLPLLI